jgi:hypothetical protein
MKPDLGLAFCDFWSGFVPEAWPLFRLLQEDFDARVDPEADIVVCGPFGRRHVGHTGTKVFCTGEPSPYSRAAYDFWIDFDLAPRPRHLRCPLFIWEMHGDRLDGVRPAGRTLEEWLGRPRFCNFIYSNPGGRVRNELFDVLNRRRPVAAPGLARNNAPPIQGGRVPQDWRRRKIAHQRDVRFTIAFESVEMAGYTTEKLLDAFVAGTIPIYWGNPAVGLDFRPGSFINAYDFASLESLAEHVLAVDADPELARRYLEVRPLYDGALDRSRDELSAFFGEVRSASRERTIRQAIRPLWLFPREYGRLAWRVARRLG